MIWEAARDGSCKISIWSPPLLHHLLLTPLNLFHLRLLLPRHLKLWKTGLTSASPPETRCLSQLKLSNWTELTEMTGVIHSMAACLTTQQYRFHYLVSLLVPWLVASIHNKPPKYIRAVVRGHKMKPFAKRDISKLPLQHLGISIQLVLEFFRLLHSPFITQWT